MSYPIYRAESRERFEQLLREDARNEATTEFLPLNPETVDQDLRDVLVHGLIERADKRNFPSCCALVKAIARFPSG